jgi:hypothetical protein
MRTNRQRGTTHSDHPQTNISRTKHRGNIPGVSFIRGDTIDTFFAREARRRPLEKTQHEFVIGSLLGDATILRTSAGWCFRVNHGLAQRPYVEYKYQFLREYVQSPPRNSGATCYFRTVTHPEFSEYRSRFYEQNRKLVPVELVHNQLSPLGLAIWIMDDGNADRGAVRLNTQSFSLAENNALAAILAGKFGLDARINRDKAGFRLRITVSSRKRLIEIVGPYFHPDMTYKLSV